MAEVKKEIQSTAIRVLAELQVEFEGQHLNRFFARELLSLLDEKAKAQGPEWGAVKQLRSFEGAQNATVLAEATVGVSPEAFHLTVVWREIALTQVAICYYHVSEGLLRD